MATALPCSTSRFQEASQINVQLWADLCVAKQRGLVLICLADFRQFEAIAQNWA